MYLELSVHACYSKQALAYSDDERSEEEIIKEKEPDYLNKILSFAGNIDDGDKQSINIENNDQDGGDNNVLQRFTEEKEKEDDGDKEEEEISSDKETMDILAEITESLKNQKFPWHTEKDYGHFEVSIFSRSFALFLLFY